MAAVIVVGRGIDTHSGQLVHWRGELGERGIEHGIAEEQVLAGGRCPRFGEPRRVEHLQYIVGRRLPAGCFLRGSLLRRHARGRCEDCEGQREQARQGQVGSLHPGLHADMRMVVAGAPGDEL